MTRPLLRSRAAAWLFAVPLRTARAWLVLLVAIPATAEAQESRLANLAIRAEASAGEPLIVGFNVGAGAEKTVLIRAVGPTLGDFGVSRPLADPRVQLFASGNARIGENDDYAAADAPVFAQVGAFGLPAGSKDAALVARLAPGGYTAHVTGAAGTSGTVLVEVYEVGSTGTPLTNLSARARVGTGDAILIPGLVLSPGATSRRVLVRAVGPGLVPFGVTGLLADPKLELFQGGARIAENDNWGTPVGPYAASAQALSTAFQRCGAFSLPAGSLDAALDVLLPPGGYTLQVSGIGGRTGEALVEVYDLTGVLEPPVPMNTREAADVLRAQIDALLAPEIDPTGAGGKVVGAAVGIIGPHVRTVLGYGVTALGSSTTPASDTLFEIGSNTKPMTGLILADRVIKGRMRLDDPVSRLLPNAPLPSFAGVPLRLVHLATHTGGLADFPDNLVGAPPNPAAGYTRALLFDYLGRATLRTRPGAAIAYSNLGFGLLGVALQEAAGAASYDALFAEVLGDPLGMKDTRVNVPASSAARSARGSRQGRLIVPSQIDTLEASGALRSTGADMLAFLAANLAPPATLQDAMALSQTVQFDLGGRRMALGFSVETRNGRTYFSKSGGTPGFTSHVRFTTSPAAGVVILTNTGQSDAAERLAETILEAVVARTVQP
jgi:CubicO group peptidase (beta-lactamase class C family)